MVSSQGWLFTSYCNYCVGLKIATCCFFFKATIVRSTINVMQFTCVVTRFDKHAVCKAQNEVPRGWMWRDLTAVLKLTRCEVSRNCYHHFSIPKNPFVLNGQFSVRSEACWENSQQFDIVWRRLFFWNRWGSRVSINGDFDLSYNRGCENWTWLCPDTHDLQGPVGRFSLRCSCSGNEGLKAACRLKRWQLFKVLKCSPPLNLLRHSEPSTRNWRSESDSLFAELA